ncbi:MAG: hypothetical protein F7B60_00645 [Desulfurococcales archaeon]|nr:hypothetical protein [Desulfurococcales archaeon]
MYADICSALEKPGYSIYSTTVIPVENGGSLSVTTGDPTLYRLDLKYIVNCSKGTKQPITFQYTATSVGKGDKEFLNNYRILRLVLVILGIVFTM